MFKLVLVCPACGSNANHACQDELNGGVWIVDSFAIESGAFPVETPTPEEYPKTLLAKVSGLLRPQTVLALNSRLVVAETAVKLELHRSPLFLGVAVTESFEWTTWLYAYTGLGGLLGLTSRTVDIRQTLLNEKAVLPVSVRNDGTSYAVLAPVATTLVEHRLPGPGFILEADELETLKRFVDQRIEDLK